jgi:hypothetical protein
MLNMETQPNIELSERVFNAFSGVLSSRRWARFFSEFQDGKFNFAQVQRGFPIGEDYGKRRWKEKKFKDYIRGEKIKNNGETRIYLTEEGQQMQNIARYFLIQDRNMPKKKGVEDILSLMPGKNHGVEKILNFLHILYTQPISEMRQLYDYFSSTTVKGISDKLQAKGLIKVKSTKVREVTGINTKTNKKKHLVYQVNSIVRTRRGTFFYEKIILPIIQYLNAEDKENTELARCIKTNWPLKSKRETKLVAKPIQTIYRVGVYVPNGEYSRMLVEKLKRTVFGNNIDAEIIDLQKGLDYAAPQFGIIFFDADSVPTGIVNRVIRDIKKTKVKEGRTKIVALTDLPKRSDILSLECDLVLQKHWLNDGNGYKEESDAFLTKYASKLADQKKYGPGGLVMGTKQFITS